MTLERKVAEVFKLNNRNWLRHANPISVWTRYSVLPLIMLALGSRYWLGWWCLLLLLVAVVWIFINPVIFRSPDSTRNWASRAVLGERVWLNRDRVPVADSTLKLLVPLLNSAAFVGVVCCGFAVWYYDLGLAFTGILITYLAKSWYLDRMVQLYETMKETNDEYRGWDF